LYISFIVILKDKDTKVDFIGPLLSAY